MFGIFVFPLLFLAAGTAGWLFVSRRQFMRRNFAGVEEFSGFISMFLTRWFERIVRAASGLAIVMGFIGLAVIPGQMRQTTAVAATAASTSGASAPALIPATARRAVLISAKCYYFDAHSRRVAIVPQAEAPHACGIPAANRV